MSWSYSGDPSASDLDALRFAIGDTVSTDPQLTDEELSYLLEQSGSVVAAGIASVNSLIARYSRYTDQRTGDIDIKYSQRIGHLRELLATMRRGISPVPYAGGISVSDIESVQGDTDRQGPVFALGMMDDPAESSDDTDEVC